MSEPTAIGSESAGSPAARPLSVLARGIDRLEAIARGEAIEAGIHKQVYDEQPVLEIEKFSLWYGHKQALFDVSLPIPRGRVTAIIGPSGCGKSTLLRCVNRMNDLIDGTAIKRGSIKIRDINIHRSDIDPIELRKRVGMVFQKSNPFPKSIYENIT